MLLLRNTEISPECSETPIKDRYAKDAKLSLSSSTWPEIALRVGLDKKWETMMLTLVL